MTEGLSEQTKLFDEDIVVRKGEEQKKRQMVGVVQRVYGEEDSDDEESDNASDDSTLQPGQVLVEWDNGEEECVEQDSLILIDRSLLHGDVVCSLQDPLKQSGTVTEVYMQCDISFLNTIDSSLHREKAMKMKNVNSKLLRPLHYFKTGAYALYKDWLCKIESCEFNIAVLFSDGAKCIIKRADPQKLLDNDVEDNSQAFFPCQQISFSNSQRKRILNQAHWINGKYNSEKHKAGIIINFTPVFVSLSFIYNINMSNEPPEEVDLNEIKIFNHFTYSNWCVNDVVVLAENEEFSHQHIPVDSYEKQAEDIRQNIVVIDRTKTVVDVEWQDGTIQKEVKSIDLQGIDHLGEYDFFPKDFVVNKSDEKEERAIQHMVGCVQTVNTKERVCSVKWLKDENGNKLEKYYEETLPIFDLLDSTDFHYRLGDVVLKLEAGDDDWAGEIIAMNYEKITVKWISGTVTECDFDSFLTVDKIESQFQDDVDNPYNIDPEKIEGDDRASEFEREMALANRIAHQTSNGDVRLVLPPHIRARLNLNNDEESEDEDDENGSWDTVSGEGEEDEDQSWDTVSEEGEERTRAPEKEDYSSGEEEEMLYERGVQDYINHLIELSNEMNDKDGRVGYKASSSEYIKKNEEEVKHRRRRSNANTAPPQPSGSTSSSENVTPTETPVEKPASSSSSDDICDQFEIVQVQEGVDILADHHFKVNQSSHVSNRKFIQIVNKEWKLLRENLPKNIYVKVFENRMDLMRAVIVGAPGTPYFDNVLVFDIYLPQTYPQTPPIVKFFSYNEKLNPNLYENGNICLSLLNTWDAKNETEAWSAKSNILQLLLSIQGLVLVSEPYFNEAGYDKQVETTEGINNSIVYNENVLLLNIRHMMKNIRHPPQHCEKIIKKHFSERGRLIVERLQVYQGEYSHPGVGTDINGLLRNPSQGFLKVLKRVVEKFSDMLE